VKDVIAGSFKPPSSNLRDIFARIYLPIIYTILIYKNNNNIHHADRRIILLPTIKPLPTPQNSAQYFNAARVYSDEN